MKLTKILPITACLPLLAGCVVYRQPAVYEQAPPPGAPPPAQVVVAEPPAPPPPQVEIVPVAPDPTFVWVGGSWEWRDRWVWVTGRWAPRPHPGAVWVTGTWVVHGHRHVWVAAHWR